jgi:FtsP/CotA-like multicopper oxidase with cupredoxin domain
MFEWVRLQLRDGLERLFMKRYAADAFNGESPQLRIRWHEGDQVQAPCT